MRVIAFERCCGALWAKLLSALTTLGMSLGCCCCMSCSTVRIFVEIRGCDALLLNIVRSIGSVSGAVVTVLLISCSVASRFFCARSWERGVCAGCWEMVMPFVWISDAVCGVGVARNTALRISVGAVAKRKN